IHWDADPNSSATGWKNIDRFTGGSASDWIVLSNGDNMVKIDAANGGEVEAGQVNLQQSQDPSPASLFPASGFLTFSSVENIQGGGSRDVFLMVGTGSIGFIDGGPNGQ